MSADTCQVATEVCVVAIGRRRGTVALIDANGAILCRNADMAKLSPAPRAVVARATWVLWADEQRHRAMSRARCTQRALDAWEAKIISWQCSLKMRKYRDSRPKRRGIWQGYPTHTWDAASQRLWFQARGQWCSGRRAPWERWAITASRNLANRRACQ